MTGFEPATSWSRTKRSTKLSYTPGVRSPRAREGKLTPPGSAIQGPSLRRRRRLLRLGADRARITITGSLKFDALDATRLPGRGPARVLRFFRMSPGRPVLIAGSTMRGEDDAVIRAFNRVRTAPGGANAMLVRVIGTKSNRSGIGTRLTLTTGGRRQLREVQSGSSYLTQNDLRAHFGLGAANRSERLEIRWPSGAKEVVEDLPANQVITVREGEGVVGRMPFRR